MPEGDMSEAASPGLLTRQTLAAADRVLALGGGEERLDLETRLLLLAAHPGTTPAQWGAVRERLDQHLEAFGAEGEEIVDAAAGLTGPGAVLRHGFALGRRRRARDGQAQALLVRIHLLRELLELVAQLEAEHPSLAAG